MSERTSKEWEDRYYGANSVIEHMADVIADLKEEVNNLSKQNRQLRSIINDIRMKIMGI